MQHELIVGSLVTFFHDLFTVFWIGGLLIFTLVITPVVRKNPEALPLLNKIQRRQSAFVLVSLLGLLVTGILLSKRSAGLQGLFGFGSTYETILSTKHIFTIAMILITFLRRSRIKASASAPISRSMKANFVLMGLNTVLGVMILYLSALLTILG